MYGQIDKIEQMKKKLNSVSPSFCLAKWMHVTLHLQTGHTHSCYLPLPHKIPLEEVKADPSAMHNTCHKKKLRKMMKEGERPEECRICWNIEDLPGDNYSDRHYRGVDDWTMPFFDKVKSMKWDDNIDPTYMEVSFSSACNFKCSYCSPMISTEWMKEIKRKGPYQLSNMVHQDIDWFKNHGQSPLPEDENPYLSAFWDWWPKLSKALMYFRITGGEPLLSKNTFKLMDWLLLNPASQLNLSINSNLGIPSTIVERFSEKMKMVMDSGNIKSHLLHTSLDTWGDQAEYIRSGLDLKLFEENLDLYLTTIPKGSVAFMCTFNNLSVVGFRGFLDKVLEWRDKYNQEGREILLDIPHLQEPHHQSVQILTPEFQAHMESHIEFMQKHTDKKMGFKEAEIFKMKRILEWMKEEKPKDWVRTHRRNFYLFFSEHDKRRETDFLKSFPEMTEFWYRCKELADSHVRKSD